MTEATVVTAVSAEKKSVKRTKVKTGKKVARKAAPAGKSAKRTLLVLDLSPTLKGKLKRAASHKGMKMAAYVRTRLEAVL